MISWMLVIPFATISLMYFSTCSAFTLNLAANSFILSQIFWGIISAHPNLVANSTSFSLTNFKIFDALSNPFAAASWISLSTSSILTFNLLAIVLNSVQIFSESKSSHFFTSIFTISVIVTAGKNLSMIFRMISWMLVIPFATISLMYFSTCSAFTLNLAANSFILSQIFWGIISAHPNLVANSTSFSLTNFKIFDALSNPFAAASWISLSTSSILTFNLLAIVLNSVHIFSERRSSHFLTSMLTISL